MKLSILDLKTTYELFPTVALLASFEHEDGREVCYTFRVDVSEYEADLTEATGLDQEDTVQRLGQNSINLKDDFIGFYDDQIHDLGVLEFMHQYELQLYQDPKQIVCSSPNFETMNCTPKKNDLFVIKEEYPGDVVFLY
jgi:hypothetical protein